MHIFYLLMCCTIIFQNNNASTSSIPETSKYKLVKTKQIFQKVNFNNEQDRKIFIDHFSQLKHINRKKIQQVCNGHTYILTSTSDDNENITYDINFYIENLIKKQKLRCFFIAKEYIDSVTEKLLVKHLLGVLLVNEYSKTYMSAAHQLTDIELIMIKHCNKEL